MLRHLKAQDDICGRDGLERSRFDIEEPRLDAPPPTELQRCKGALQALGVTSSLLKARQQRTCAASHVQHSPRSKIADDRLGHGYRTCCCRRLDRLAKVGVVVYTLGPHESMERTDELRLHRSGQPRATKRAWPDSTIHSSCAIKDPSVPGHALNPPTFAPISCWPRVVRSVPEVVLTPSTKTCRDAPRRLRWRVAESGAKSRPWAPDSAGEPLLGP